MSLGSTVSAERVHIGFFGNTNAGKSSLVNKVTSQQTALVSEISGRQLMLLGKLWSFFPSALL